MTIKYYEIFINNDYAICIKAYKKPSKKEVYDYLKQYEFNAKQFDFSVKDIKIINEISEQDGYNLYNMNYINNLPILDQNLSKYGDVWIHCIRDCGENEGGYFCEVYDNYDCDDRIDYFCIHPEDCDCSNEEAVENFIEEYAKMYNKTKINIMYELLKNHIGHNIVCVAYGDVNDPDDICIECEDCNEVLISAETFEDED